MNSACSASMVLNGFLPNSPLSMHFSDQPFLEVNDLSVRFGGIHALRGVGFKVQAGEICGLIGPNGAGKTTLFNCLSRLYVPYAGEIRFDGVDLLALPVHAVARAGLGRTFQNLAIFGSMTVLENVLVGALGVGDTGFAANALWLRRVATERREAVDRAQALLDLVGLSSLADSPAASLPFGLQKRMETARALASRPKLLMLDEPAAGLNQEEIASLDALVRVIRGQLGVTVLLVEHHMELVMNLCDRVVVLNFGEKIAEGDPAAIRAHPRVIQAYLGTGEEHHSVH